MERVLYDGGHRPERQSGQLHVLDFVQLGCVERLRGLQLRPLSFRIGCGGQLPGNRLPWTPRPGSATGSRMDSRRTLARLPVPRRLGLIRSTARSPGEPLEGISRNGGAAYFLPSANEWYKAAYYNPSNATYWTFPTQSNSIPSNALSSTGTNNANHANWTGSGWTFTDAANYRRRWGRLPARPAPTGRMTWEATSGNGTKRHSTNCVISGAALGSISLRATSKTRPSRRPRPNGRTESGVRLLRNRLPRHRECPRALDHRPPLPPACWATLGDGGPDGRHTASRSRPRPAKVHRKMYPTSIGGACGSNWQPARQVGLAPLPMAA